MISQLLVTALSSLSNNYDAPCHYWIVMSCYHNLYYNLIKLKKFRFGFRINELMIHRWVKQKPEESISVLFSELNISRSHGLLLGLCSQTAVNQFPISSIQLRYEATLAVVHLWAVQHMSSPFKMSNEKLMAFNKFWGKKCWNVKIPCLWVLISVMSEGLNYWRCVF